MFHHAYNMYIQYCGIPYRQIAVCSWNNRKNYCWWDGGEWEWQNSNEPDGTPDQSELTSVVTDYRGWTSAEDDISDLSHNTDYGFLYNSCYYNVNFPNPAYCHRKEVANNAIQVDSSLDSIHYYSVYTTSSFSEDDSDNYCTSMASK